MICTNDIARSDIRKSEFDKFMELPGIKNRILNTSTMINGRELHDAN